jgi:AraC family transcriptional regulator, transcriptional activator of pobA
MPHPNIIYSPNGEYLLALQHIDRQTVAEPAQHAQYAVILVTAGEGTFHADSGVFAFSAPTLLFATPLQTICIKSDAEIVGTMLQFHSDFYCIEYHRKEVACNGLLFNNIYIDPIVKLTPAETARFAAILTDIEEEATLPAPSEIVMRSCLQLFLARSSSIKLKELDQGVVQESKDEKMERFRQLLDQHYLELHKPSDYASLLAMSPDNFTRRCTNHYKRTPSQMIQERLILEAKKQLHLTRQSIKEIAFNLKFQDEFYFSRFFKKVTKVSPQAFRDMTGISIVADLHKENQKGR